MAVNENCNDISYVLGRLFSVLENIQLSANHGINSTIKDRYFNSACATPAAVFPLLWKLTNAHLGKLDQPKAAYFKKNWACSWIKSPCPIQEPRCPIG